MGAFPKCARLCTPKAYARVFKRGKRCARPHVMCILAPNAVAHARLGLAIRKKDLKKATHRNTVKRVARECFRALYPTLPPLDIVVLSTHRLGALTHPDLRVAVRKDLDNCLHTLIPSPVPHE